MLKSRIITAVILLLLLLLVLFALPDSWWIAVVVLVVMQGTLEWSKLSKLSGRNAYIYSALTLALMLMLVWFDNNHTDAEQVIPHLMIYAVSALLWLIIVPTWMIAGWRVESQFLMCLTGWAVLMPTGLAMLDLHAISPWVLLLLMGLVWVADIGAYFAGRRFGKNKLAPSISPGKTWEGVAGGMLGVSVYVLIVHAVVPFAFLPVLLLAAWWWVGLAVIGDLFESAIKRQAGVKDSGALLPGHGGLLDRIDALTSTLPLATMVILFGQLS
ncbi:MAG: phosphatidate cytidylyltransferase [Proteobacteria bacterium]|nr:phosphatidate cytidylyltransferase [Pseudomonadota bacterium]